MFHKLMDVFMIFLNFRVYVMMNGWRRGGGYLKKSKNEGRVGDAL